MGVRRVVVVGADGERRTLTGAQWQVSETGCLTVLDNRAVAVASFAVGHWRTIDLVEEDE